MYFPAEVQSHVDKWVAERVAEPLTGWGHKADPWVVEEDSAELAEGVPKGKTAAKVEGKPTKPPTNPAPKAKAAKPTPPVSAPPADPAPIPFPLEETLRGISDGVVHTVEGNVQTTLRHIFPSAMREALKAELAAKATREVQKLRGELAVAMSQVKAAEKRAQELQETQHDTKRQKLESQGELKHISRNVGGREGPVQQVPLNFGEAKVKKFRLV